MNNQDRALQLAETVEAVLDKVDVELRLILGDQHKIVETLGSLKEDYKSLSKNKC